MIPHVIQQTIEAHAAESASTLQAVRRADRWAREHALGVARELVLKT